MWCADDINLVLLFSIHMSLDIHLAAELPQYFTNLYDAHTLILLDAQHSEYQLLESRIYL
jgi:hypothetical protein